MQTYIERYNTNQFRVASRSVKVWHSPLQWNVVGVVDLDVVSSIPGNSLLLGEANTAVLQWSEYCSRHFVVVTLHVHTELNG